MSDYIMFFTLDAIAVGAVLYYYIKDRESKTKHESKA